MSESLLVFFFFSSPFFLYCCEIFTIYKICMITPNLSDFSCELNHICKSFI